MNIEPYLKMYDMYTNLYSIRIEWFQSHMNIWQALSQSSKEIPPENGFEPISRKYFERDSLRHLNFRKFVFSAKLPLL